MHLSQQLFLSFKGQPIGVSTPETRDPRKPVQDYGDEASRFTTSLLKNQLVRL
jgi:endonuclease YncB( thermonuclease family)